MLSLTKLLHSAFGQISAIVCYDAVRKAEAEDHLFHKLNRRGCITLANWLSFHPLREFVHCHQEVGLLIFGSLEGPYHIKPPSSKRPSDGDHA